MPHPDFPTKKKEENLGNGRHRSVRVHQGILKAYTSVRGTIWTELKNICTDGERRVLLVTGHSLGGALATLCAFDFAIHSQESNFLGGICSFTFAQPKVGNPGFKKKYNEVVPCTKRFAMDNDTIPKLPPRLLLSRDHYEHCGTEVLLDMNGNMIVDPSIVERYVQRGFAGFSTRNHYRGAYHLSLILWCAKTHREEWTPRWWIIVVDHLFLYYTPLLQTLSSDYRAKINDQVNIEGTTFLVGDTTRRHCGTQTGMNMDDELNFATRGGLGSEPSAVLESMVGLSECDHVYALLRSTNIEMEKQDSYGAMLINNGYTTRFSLESLTSKDLKRMGFLSVNDRLGFLKAVADRYDDDQDTDIYIESQNQMNRDSDSDTISGDEDLLSDDEQYV